MRLGGPVFPKDLEPHAWAKAVRSKGYGAAFCPVKAGADAKLLEAYLAAAREHDVLIAEVGAWSNPIAADQAERKKAIAYNIQQLAHAEATAARCCVNIAGARGEKWDGPHPENLTRATFDLIVETVRGILDAVKPTRTYYALETMPWIFPDSPGRYLELLKAIDRPRFAVHLDPVNMINSPARLFGNAQFLRECFAKLGRYIRSCHGKDSRLHPKLTVHLDEVRPGLGALDYGVFLEELDKLDPDTPLMLEHLPDEAEYDLAAAHVRGVAKQKGLAFR